MMLGSIKAAQEAFREETQRYMNVSNGDYEATHPFLIEELIDQEKRNWDGQTRFPAENFYALQVASDAPVQYTYSCVAGAPSVVPPTPLAGSPTVPTPTWPNPPGEVWYVAEAIGDLDGDGTQGVFGTASFSSEIWVERDGE